MSSLVPAPRALPVVGTPARWSRDLALFGALIPIGTVLPYLAMGWGWSTFLRSPLVLFVLVSAAMGAAIGAVAPAVLERLRGRVSLRAIGVGSTVLSAAVGAVAGLLTPSALAGALLFGSIGALMWLPYLMTRVLRKPTLPLVVMGALVTGAAYDRAVWLLISLVTG